MINIPFSERPRTAFEAASLVKNLDRNIPVVLEGVFLQRNLLDCLSNPSVDFVIIGESELTALERASLLLNSDKNRFYFLLPSLTSPRIFGAFPELENLLAFQILD